jgi:catechol 2,3-dioxygenase-like lactoylglutathione lyase family enzyme
MKRLHVNVAVEDLEASIGFYSSLFGLKPTVCKDDYAKWMLDDPRINFAITSRGTRKGIDHLGIQVDNREELAEIYSRLEAAEAPLIDQGSVTCCYAQSEKKWSYDPEGIAWETFLTTGESTAYGTDGHSAEGRAGACCDLPFIENASGNTPCCVGEIRT